MQYQFSRVPTVDTPRSSFDRTHTHKTTFNAGELIPFYIDEALPGDTFNLNATLFGRISTLLNPIMDNIVLDTHYFAVPKRLVWDNFQKFMGEQENPNDTTDYIVPQLQDVANVGFSEGSLEDYFGLPTANQATGLSVSALWHRAYNLIWNEWFRDQNLQDAVPVPKDDGPDYYGNDYQILKRAKRHDYFTSALPWPQKGPGVELPLGASANVDISNLTIQANGNLQFGKEGLSGSAPIRVANTGALSTTGFGGFNSPDKEIFYDNGLEISGDVTADLSTASAATINSLRQAFQLQRLAEKDARGGTRYTEIVRSHFNVTSPDARLQRPEFLGGDSIRLDVQQVPVTAASYGTNYLHDKATGDLAGMGSFSGAGTGFTKSFTEHTLIIGLVSARADVNYQQGVNRMFSRRTKYDYYWPSLAHLGEQTIKVKEIYAQGQKNNNSEEDEETFGYQERWSEYRYYPNKITGKMRSYANQSLDLWHLAQDFANKPLLNSTFIEENPPIDRVVAIPTEPDFIMDSHIAIRTARPMPTYSVPGLIDHF